MAELLRWRKMVETGLFVIGHRSNVRTYKMVNYGENVIFTEA